MDRFKQWIPVIVRTLMGLIFFVFGLNGFFQWMTPEVSGEGGGFLSALADTGYMLPMLKLTETIAGLFLLLGRFVPLALTLLAPIIVNILGFHAFLSTEGLGMAVVLVVAEIYLAWAYRNAFGPMLNMNARPTA